MKKRSTFKLKSGNKPAFKLMGEETTKAPDKPKMTHKQKTDQLIRVTSRKKKKKPSGLGVDGKPYKEKKKPKMTDKAFMRIRSRKEAQIKALMTDVDKIPRKEAKRRYLQASKIQGQIDAADKRYDELNFGDPKSNDPTKNK